MTDLQGKIETLRQQFIAASAARQRADWDIEYQEICDRTYWEFGQCCAGCDHWRSDMGNVGECTAAAPVSGVEVMKSLGLTSCSYTPAPGHPCTRSTDKCGKFKDDFDWSTLDRNYLIRIGAFGVVT